MVTIILLILLRFHLKKNQSHEILSTVKVQDKYTDLDYIKKHKIQPKYFTYNSSGDTGKYSISNVFDDIYDTIWVSKCSNTNFFRPYVFINFSKPFNIKGIIYDTVYKTVGNKNDRIFDGFPLVFNVFSSLNNENLELQYVYLSDPTFSMEKIYFIFTQPILCDKLKLEFANVTFDSQFSFNYSACSRGITFIESGNDRNYLNSEICDVQQTKIMKEEQEYCEEKPSNSYDMSSDSLRSNVILYSCNNIFYERFGYELCVFLVYHTTFNSIHEPTQDGGAVYIFNKGKSVYGNIKFYKSTFSNCTARNGGSIFIFTAQQVRSYNISNCTFINNEAIPVSNISSSGSGGAICFRAAVGIIFGCDFINNVGPLGGCIHYEDKAANIHLNRIFNISNNRFFRKKIKSNECSVLYIYIIDISIFNFANNTIISSTNSDNSVSIIESYPYNRTSGNWTFSSNIVFPCNATIYSQDNLLTEIINNSFNICNNDPDTSFIIDNTRERNLIKLKFNCPIENGDIIIYFSCSTCKLKNYIWFKISFFNEEINEIIYDRRDIYNNYAIDYFLRDISYDNETKTLQFNTGSNYIILMEDEIMNNLYCHQLPTPSPTPVPISIPITEMTVNGSVSCSTEECPYHDYAPTCGLKCWTDGDEKASFEYQFKGERFQIYGANNQSCGTYSVFLDGNKIATVNQNSMPFSEKIVQYTSDILPYGIHTIKAASDGNGPFHFYKFSYWPSVEATRFNSTEFDGEWVIESDHIGGLREWVNNHTHSNVTKVAKIPCSKTVLALFDI